MIVLLFNTIVNIAIMEQLLSSLSIRVNDTIYTKNPDTSDLGRKIIAGSIDLIHAHGLEGFTFSKLGKHIGSTEASIYRYFENKHKLLLYLVSWYWRWLEYRLVFAISNIDSAEKRLLRAVQVLTEPTGPGAGHRYVDLEKLGEIVISESSKVYLTKLVDEENRYGAFAGYKELVARVSDIITEIDPEFKYPHMLVTTIIEGAHHQRFFQAHLPRLTDVVEGEDAICAFYQDLTRKVLGI